MEDEEEKNNRVLFSSEKFNKFINELEQKTKKKLKDDNNELRCECCKDIISEENFYQCDKYPQFCICQQCKGKLESFPTDHLLIHLYLDIFNKYFNKSESLKEAGIKTLEIIIPDQIEEGTTREFEVQIEKDGEKDTFPIAINSEKIVWELLKEIIISQKINIDLYSIAIKNEEMDEKLIIENYKEKIKTIFSTDKKVKIILTEENEKKVEDMGKIYFEEEENGKELKECFKSLFKRWIRKTTEKEHELMNKEQFLGVFNDKEIKKLRDNVFYGGKKCLDEDIILKKLIEIAIGRDDYLFFNLIFGFEERNVKKPYLRVFKDEKKKDEDNEEKGGNKRKKIEKDKSNPEETQDNLIKDLQEEIDEFIKAKSGESEEDEDLDEKIKNIKKIAFKSKIKEDTKLPEKLLFHLYVISLFSNEKYIISGNKNKFDFLLKAGDLFSSLKELKKAEIEFTVSSGNIPHFISKEDIPEVKERYLYQFSMLHLIENSVRYIEKLTLKKLEQYLHKPKNQDDDFLKSVQYLLLYFEEYKIKQTVIDVFLFLLGSSDSVVCSDLNLTLLCEFLKFFLKNGEKVQFLYENRSNSLHKLYGIFEFLIENSRDKKYHELLAVFFCFFAYFFDFDQTYIKFKKKIKEIFNITNSENLKFSLNFFMTKYKANKFNHNYKKVNNTLTMQKKRYQNVLYVLKFFLMNKHCKERILQRIDDENKENNIEEEEEEYLEEEGKVSSSNSKKNPEESEKLGEEYDLSKTQHNVDNTYSSQVPYDKEKDVHASTNWINKDTASLNKKPKKNESLDIHSSEVLYNKNKDLSADGESDKDASHPKEIDINASTNDKNQNEENKKVDGFASYNSENNESLLIKNNKSNVHANTNYQKKMPGISEQQNMERSKYSTTSMKKKNIKLNKPKTQPKEEEKDTDDFLMKIIKNLDKPKKEKINIDNIFPLENVNIDFECIRSCIQFYNNFILDNYPDPNQERIIGLFRFQGTNINLRNFKYINTPPKLLFIETLYRKDFPKMVEIPTNEEEKYHLKGIMLQDYGDTIALICADQSKNIWLDMKNNNYIVDINKKIEDLYGISKKIYFVYSTKKEKKKEERIDYFHKPQSIKKIDDCFVNIFSILFGLNWKKFEKIYEYLNRSEDLCDKFIQYYDKHLEDELKKKKAKGERMQFLFKLESTLGKLKNEVKNKRDYKDLMNQIKFFSEQKKQIY